jgi:hypothetical protein
MLLSENPLAVARATVLRTSTPRASVASVGIEREQYFTQQSSRVGN